MVLAKYSKSNQLHAGKKKWRSGTGMDGGVGLSFSEDNISYMVVIYTMTLAIIINLC